MKFVTKYPVDGMPPLNPDGDGNWLIRNKVKRSVNGFIMETFCELLNRPCTRHEMEYALSQWPDPCPGRPLDAISVIQSRTRLKIESEPLVAAGLQERLDTLHQATVAPSESLPPVNMDAIVGPSSDIPDPDILHRYLLRRRILMSPAYHSHNLRRMIANVLNRALWSDSKRVVDYEHSELKSLVERYRQRYADAIRADLEGYLDAGKVPPDECNNRARFGRELYSELCAEYGINPIQDGVNPNQDDVNNFSWRERLVFAYYFCWYFNNAQLPGPGPYDVWSPHPHTRPSSTDWISWAGGESNPWGPQLPGSVHGVWRLDRQQSKDFLRQDFMDAVEAGIDVLIFNTWIRPGATVYPWLPEGSCNDWWAFESGDWGADSGGLGWLRLAVEVLNEMKEQNLSTPKLALGLETPQLGPRFSNRAAGWPLKTNKDPLNWASCTMSGVPGAPPQRRYSADWGTNENGDYEDRDPGHEEDGNDYHSGASDERMRFVWPFAFLEAQRYLASMARTALQEVPLEHLAFSEGRPMIYLWQVLDGIDAALTDHESPEARVVSRLISEEFYGLGLWVIADTSWRRGHAPKGNDFVYWEKRVPSDPGSEDFRVGDAVEWNACLRGFTDPTYSTIFAVAPGYDGTTKTWAPDRNGNTRNAGDIN